jgi:hypothetical protein
MRGLACPQRYGLSLRAQVLLANLFKKDRVFFGPESKR